MTYRATRLSLDPLAFSTRGGRWAKPGGAAVLYTSLEREGALAEISHHWAMFDPLPTKPVLLHRLVVSTNQTLRLLRGDLTKLGVSDVQLSELPYQQTQEIGAAVAFLGHDGLIVPSARWNCQNLILFNDNHSLECQLEAADCETVDWQDWAKVNGFLDDAG